MYRFIKQVFIVIRMKSNFDQKLFRFVEDSQDGYALLDSDDVLIYCNRSYSDAIRIPHDELIGMYFEDILRRSYAEGEGIKIDSDDIEEWLKYVRSVRRIKKFRIFEVDYMDGRWFLISEQINEAGEMLLQLKEMTKQKALEKGLHSSLESLAKLALTDELTKVANRRSFVDSVNSELSRCRRTGASMSLLIFDLDHFKKINDNYGHPAGDKVLIHISKLVSESLRAYDILGRIGGEEFGVFLSNTPIEKAIEIAERIRSSIENSSINFEGTKISFSASIGMTTLGCSAKFEELYEQADQALYEAKQAGRNQVVRFEK